MDDPSVNVESIANETNRIIELCKGTNREEKVLNLRKVLYALSYVKSKGLKIEDRELSRKLDHDDYAAFDAVRKENLDALKAINEYTVSKKKVRFRENINAPPANQPVQPVNNQPAQPSMQDPNWNPFEESVSNTRDAQNQNVNVGSANKTITNSIINPTKAPFKRAYTIYASYEREKVDKMYRQIKEVEATPAIEFVRRSERNNISNEAAEAIKTEFLKQLHSMIPSEEKLQSRSEVHRERYKQLKKYFEDKITELGLKQPLIFFDEAALRIDIGYGPKEFETLFPDFTNGPFRRLLYPDISMWKIDEVFKENAIDEDYKKELNNEAQQILTRANQIFNQANEHLPEKKPIELPSNHISEQGLIHNILQVNDNKAFILGENHNDQSPKQFLIDNMAYFKTQGVTTLYFEHLLHDKHQRLLDEYFNDKTPNAVMPIELKLYLQHLDKERKFTGSATFTNVVKAAKENGIRIIAIDTEATYQLGAQNNLADLTNRKGTEDRFKYGLIGSYFSKR